MAYGRMTGEILSFLYHRPRAVLAALAGAALGLVVLFF